MSLNALHLHKLIIQCLEGAISSQELEQLNRALIEDPEARRIYADVTFINSQISSPGNIGTYLFEQDDLLRSSFDDELWDDLAYEEKTAPAIEIIRSEPPMELIRKVERQRVTHTFSKANIVSIVMSAAAILFFILFVQIAPHPSSSVHVATLVDQLDAQWADPALISDEPVRLRANEGAKDLRKGFAEIHFDSGVDVLIEGPASFEIERSGVYLEYGRLYSRVSESGIGFRVETPTSQFIDLGTEFGVLADVNGSSEVHVTKGKVQFYAGSKGRAKVGQLLSENDAVRYDVAAEEVKNIPIQQNSFVRDIHSTSNLVWRGQKVFSLADVVGGGNGFGSGSQEQWIDIVEAKYIQGTQSTLWRKSGTSQYCSFDAHPFIDGVFIPNGQSGPLQVSSEEHQFMDCPSTNGQYWNGMFNSIGRIEDIGKTTSRNDLVLDGVEYNSSSKPSISIHSNQGITFDLEAVRNQMSGTRVVQFTAKAGVSQSVRRRLLRDENGALLYPKASFYVLIDGQVRFAGIDHDFRNPSLDIRVDLAPTDRFLTLIVTEGSDSSTNDWALFAEPFLHLR